MSKITTKQKIKVKSFKRWLKEERNTSYALDLIQGMSNEEVAFSIADLTPYAVKMLKKGDVTITLEPVFEEEE